MTANQSRFEEDVRVEASTRLGEFLAGNPARTNGEIVVRVLISTDRRLSVTARDEIRAALRQVARSYRNAVPISEFETDAANPDRPRVTCTPMRRTHEEPRPTEEADPYRSGGQLWLFVLHFGSLRFEYLLPSQPGWVRLLRPHGTGEPDGLQVPRSMTAFPSGHLVDVRRYDHAFALRRTAVRADEVTVWVNRFELPAHLSNGLEVADSGRIEFVRAGETSSIEYELTEWPEVELGPPGRVDRLDGSPYLAPIMAGDRSGVVRITPPAGEQIRSRSFPIQSAGAARAIHTQVLYTRGDSTDPEPAAWHIKIYRCATPQHAAGLRRYLETQAKLVEQINAAAGGSVYRPPWAIVPVQVLPAAGPDGVPRPTELGVPAGRVAGDPENRLSAWFGVAARPQPDCFVIVASPLQSGVGWAGADLRRTAPGIDQLPALATLARGIDACHRQEIAHCDVKPDNVCRYLEPDGVTTGYVLIDGDAVTRASGRIPELRFTEAYASAEMIARARRLRAPNRDQPPESKGELVEHDRFGFVLVVLTAVAGTDRVAGLLTPNEDGRRVIDDRERVASALRGYWGDPQWQRFVTELLTAFEPNALLTEDWSADAWLCRLREIADQTTNAQPRRGDATEQPALGRHGRHVMEIRAKVRSKPRGHTDGRIAVVELIKHHQLLVARAGQRKELALGALPMVFVLVLLIGWIWGR